MRSYKVAIFESFSDGSTSDALFEDEATSHAEVGKFVENFMRDVSKKGATYEITVEVSS